MSTPAFPETYAKATGIVKKRVSRWPSAYASGQVVREYRRLVAKTHGPRARPYMERRRTTSIARRLAIPHILAAIRIKQRAKTKTARYAWPKNNK